MNRVAIIGLGLIGGSLALALKRSAAVKVEIVGFSRRSATMSRAIERGIIDRAAEDLVSAVKEADLVIIATPVMTIKDVLEQVSAHLAPGCVVTDTGSTKVKVMQWADEYLPSNVSFIGGHPMAGKETSGINESDPDLFRDCIYCLTPAPSATAEAVQAIEERLGSIGARPFLIDAKAHDNLVAGISHLPMLLSAAFVSTTVGNPSWSEMAKLAARGYRDLSRLASGNPEMNSDICLTNREEIIYWVDCYLEELKEYRRLILEDGGGLRNALASAREAREEWLREDGS